MRQRVFLTGASGGMGMAGLRQLLDAADLDVVSLVRPSERNRALLAPFAGRDGLTIVWGDLTNYDDVLACVRDADVVLHVGAFVSPEADDHPRRAMEINYGSTMNILTAIAECGQEQSTKLVYIGTIAETGDRMPPIHWGRVGDPLKPSVFDYYAVSKIAAERAVIESGLKYWVSLRQTGILSKKMTEIEDAIIFHNPLDNVLEYVSDRDSGVLLRNCCGDLPDEFFNHVYNIGGGEACRTSTRQMYQRLYGELGITDLGACLDSKWFATRNFHGHYYLDSDVLEEHLHFRNDSLQYLFDVSLAGLGRTVGVSRTVCRLPFGQRIIGSAMKRRFLTMARAARGTVGFIEQDRQDAIAAYWGSRDAWLAIPPLAALPAFADWDTVVHIDHGYDETRPESELDLDAVRGAARFRGGSCEAESMAVGDWSTKLDFRCAFGHEFTASPRLVLHAGHWCDVCERSSWNYHERAERDPFFAQVWRPLHPADEPAHSYPKEVSELEVRYGPAPAPVG